MRGRVAWLLKEGRFIYLNGGAVVWKPGKLVWERRWGTGEVEAERGAVCARLKRKRS